MDQDVAFGLWAASSLELYCRSKSRDEEGEIHLARGRTLYLAVMIAAAVAVACAVALSALSEKEEATFPGKNGRIAYASYAERCRLCIVGYPGRDPEIYTINPNGRGKFQLTHNNEIDLEPSYSPDGKRIAYARSDGHDQEIYTINAGGKDKIQLTHNNKDDFEPSYSPNGKRIAYRGLAGLDDKCDCPMDIYTIKVVGGGKTKVTNTDNAYEFQPSWESRL